MAYPVVSRCAYAKIIIVDGSLALLNAITLEIYDCYYNDYLEKCYNFLKRKSSKPICLIKRDRNHLIKNVCQWVCFEKKPWHVKDFYVRIIGYCLGINNLILLEETLREITIVCNSDTIDEGSKSYLSFTRLMDKIKTFKYNTPKEQCSTKNNTEQKIESNSNSILRKTERFEVGSSQIAKYIHDIYNESLGDCSNASNEKYSTSNT